MAKNTRWLFDYEAKSLGLDIKPNEENRKNARYQVKDKDWESLKEARNSGVLDACRNVGVDPSNAPMLWLKTKSESVRVTNPLFIAPEVKSFENLQETLIKELKKYSPKFPKIQRIEDSNSYLLVIDPADIHIGKLCSAFEVGEEYNNQIAVKRVLEGVRGILDKVRGYSIDKILFIGGNDILHIDSPQRKTTSGTPQDTDGM